MATLNKLEFKRLTKSRDFDDFIEGNLNTRTQWSHVDLIPIEHFDEARLGKFLDFYVSGMV